MLIVNTILLPIVATSLLQGTYTQVLGKMLCLSIDHRHLNNIDCLKVCTAWMFASLVLLMATAKEKKKKP